MPATFERVPIYQTKYFYHHWLIKDLTEGVFVLMKIISIIVEIPSAIEANSQLKKISFLSLSHLWQNSKWTTMCNPVDSRPEV